MQLKGLRAIKRRPVPVTGPSAPLTVPSVPSTGPPFPLRGPSKCLIVGHSAEILIAQVHWVPLRITNIGLGQT